jgi:hypothetical protein
MKKLTVISILFLNQIIFSQNNLIYFKINNDSIFKCKTTLLEIEIVNKSTDTIFVPFDKRNFTSYELIENENNVSFSENIEIEGIMPSIRVFDSVSNKLQNHSVNYPFSEITIFDLIQINYIEEQKKLLQKIYKKHGIVGDKDFIFNLNYLCSNLYRIEPNSSIKFYLSLDLNNFETKYLNNEKCLPDGFQISDRNYKFMLKWIYDESYMKPYNNIISKKIIHNNKIIIGTYVSNSISISFCN